MLHHWRKAIWTMYVYCSLFTTKENNQSGKNGFTIYYVRTEVEIIVLKLWKKSIIFNTNLQYWPLSRYTGPYVCYPTAHASMFVRRSRPYVCPILILLVHIGLETNTATFMYVTFDIKFRFLVKSYMSDLVASW